MTEDPNEQLGKLVHSGYFFGDKIQERIDKGLCPHCIVTLKQKENGDLECIACKAIIRNAYEKKEHPLMYVFP